jgi:hypothetical protein
MPRDVGSHLFLFTLGRGRDDAELHEFLCEPIDVFFIALLANSGRHEQNDYCDGFAALLNGEDRSIP